MPGTYFVADSSRICGSLCGFIGCFERFHLDESGADVKMNGMGCLDGLVKGILTEGCWIRDEIVNQKKVMGEFLDYNPMLKRDSFPPAHKAWLIKLSTRIWSLAESI